MYALDFSTIDLCLSLFPWAKFRKHKGGIKLHTLPDLRGSIPSVVIVTDPFRQASPLLNLFFVARATCAADAAPAIGDHR